MLDRIDTEGTKVPEVSKIIYSLNGSYLMPDHSMSKWPENSNILSRTPWTITAIKAKSMFKAWPTKSIRAAITPENILLMPEAKAILLKAIATATVA